MINKKAQFNKILKSSCTIWKKTLTITVVLSAITLLTNYICGINANNASVYVENVLTGKVAGGLARIFLYVGGLTVVNVSIISLIYTFKEAEQGYIARGLIRAAKRTPTVVAIYAAILTISTSTAMLPGLLAFNGGVAIIGYFLGSCFSLVALVHISPATYLSIIHDKNAIAAIKHSICLTRKNWWYMCFWLLASMSVGVVCYLFFSKTNGFSLNSNLHFLWNNAYTLLSASFGHAIMIVMLCVLEEKKEVS